MALTVQVLGEAPNIQFSGVQDRSGTTPILGVVNALIVGMFRRGRFDKPMRITQSNICSELGYEPNNPDYQAVQDVIDKYGSVYVLRVGDLGWSVVTQGYGYDWSGSWGN